jgi:hydrogenase maturation protein HypF
MTSIADQASDAPAMAARIRVEGTVQGVGFRPFVYRLAAERELAGWVANDPSGVNVEVEGRVSAVVDFIRAVASPPGLGEVTSLTVQTLEVTGRRGFRIDSSSGAGVPWLAIPPDAATCDACLAETDDPGNRRYAYPFTNCTECGPRFTIVEDAPYDRSRTTMAGFDLCPACRAEYLAPANRRFHAEPVCCPRCGPRLDLITGESASFDGQPVREAARLLREGKILAVKGLGGYHLAALASNARAVEQLRRRKVREDKPFALMATDLDAAGVLCRIDEAEAALLLQPARPIVLLRRRPNAPVAEAVAPGSQWLGVMLPYTPLHHLLLRHTGAPIVLTSGNRADEPIAFEDADALSRLAGIADAFLVHDRPIRIRTDDSVARVMGGSPMLMRRSRGHVPRPVRLPVPAARPILACGGQLKSTFCLAREDRAVVSHHIGDLEHPAAFRSWIDGIDHFRRLLDLRPEVVAFDLHPEYLSTKHALEMEDVDLVGVQHHHAHIAACLADNGRTGPVLGVAFDGFGWGPDGTLWGGEILVADLVSYRKVGGLMPVPLPGGSAAVREPWRMAVSYLWAAFGGEPGMALGLLRQPPARLDQVAAVAHSPRCRSTSSAGRLFDAIAALAVGRGRATFEGQAAMELEQHADAAETGSYEAGIEVGSEIRIRGTDLVRAAAEDLLAGRSSATVAARFHNGLARGVVEACQEAAGRTGLRTVAVSGGVFQNVLLFEAVLGGLAESGLEVLIHSQVPPNDGGISLGQAAVAAARSEAGFTSSVS